MNKDFNKSISILFTGGAGMIGRYLVKRIREYYYSKNILVTFIILDNFTTSDKNKLPKGDLVKYVSTDIADPYRTPDKYLLWSHSHVIKRRTGRIFDNPLDCDLGQGKQTEEKVNQRLGNPDLIFHMADIPRVFPLKQTFKEYQNSEYKSDLMDVNLVGTKNILEFAIHGQQDIDVEKRNIWGWENTDYAQVFYFSNPQVDDYFKDEHTFTKYQGEQLCKLYSKMYNLNVGILKFGKIKTKEEYYKKYAIDLDSVYDKKNLTTYDNENMITLDKLYESIIELIGKNLEGKEYVII